MSWPSVKRSLLVTTALSLLAACSGNTAPDEARVEFHSPPEAKNSPGPPGAGSQGSGVLNFTAPKLGGGQVVGSELAGQNVAIWFWAPW